jgi:L-threonylcarbamoyladenylate synthase
MIIIYPTETSYALGCKVFDRKAILRVRELKKRDEGKCLPVVVHDIEQWRDVAVFNEGARALAKAFWPGPLTLVTEKKDSVPNELCPNSIACRISPHEIVSAITAELGPLVATSANFAGEPNSYEIDEIPTQIKEAADWVIDNGKLSGKPSTVYNTLTHQVVREGPISMEKIIEKIKNK